MGNFGNHDALMKNIKFIKNLEGIDKYILFVNSIPEFHPTPPPSCNTVSAPSIHLLSPTLEL